MNKSENEGRMMCVQCQNEYLFSMIDDQEENKSLYPVLGVKGQWACIYHGELAESQMIFVPFADGAARAEYFKHEDRVFKTLGVGKYAGKGNPVSSQSEVLSRMKELKLELSRTSKLETSRKYEEIWEIWGDMGTLPIFLITGVRLDRLLKKCLSVRGYFFKCDS